MSRINSNVSSLIAQSNLSKTQKDLQLHLERLSTGLRINRGADDPAGLIISERLRTDINGVSQGIKNSERASSVISTTESSLAEINDLLNSIKGLLVESANTGANSKDERDANQLQIDSAIDSITRISNTASFGGLRLLNGNLDYRISGLQTSAISRAQVTNASFIGSQSLQVDVDVVASAQTAALYFNGGSVNPPGVTLSTITLQVAGNRGVEEITVPKGQSFASVVSAVNRLTILTGVKASLINGSANSGIVFQSETYGSDSFVSVKRQGSPLTTGTEWFKTHKFANNAPVVSGASFNWTTLTGSGTLVTADRDEGQNVQALINGNLANGDGLKVKVNSSALGMSLILNENFATDPSAANSTFTITGGGALFQLGQDVTALQQVNLGIASTAASNLGATSINGTIEFLSSIKSGQGNSISASVARGDFSPGSEILNSAIDEISLLRGRLGAFGRNTLDTNVRSLQSSFENLNASVSVIRDADFAAETSQLTRAQILSSAGNSVLGLANQQSQQVLQLLG